MSSFLFWAPAFVVSYILAYRVARLQHIRFQLYFVAAPLLWAYWAAVPLWSSPPSMKPFVLEWAVLLIFGAIVLPALLAALVLFDLVFPSRAAVAGR